MARQWQDLNLAIRLFTQYRLWTALVPDLVEAAAFWIPRLPEMGGFSLGFPTPRFEGTINGSPSHSPSKGSRTRIGSRVLRSRGLRLAIGIAGAAAQVTVKSNPGVLGSSLFIPKESEQCGNSSIRWSTVSFCFYVRARLCHVASRLCQKVSA